MKHYGIITLLATLLLLSACGPIEKQHRVNLAYAPQNLHELKSQVSVQPFDYYNQYHFRNDALTLNAWNKVVFSDSLGVYFQKAIQKEFRFSGMSVKEGNCRLRGTLHAINAAYIEATYILHDKYDNILYTEVHSASGTSSYTTEPYEYVANFHNAISKNIGLLLNDDKFMEALEKC